MSTIELARQEGTEFRSVRLSLKEDGAVEMQAQDIGPAVEQVWQDSDYEFWVTITAASVPKLAFELLREKFAGKLGAVGEFRDWCRTHGVEFEFGNWS